jgi:hypothetical protein
MSTFYFEPKHVDELPFKLTVTLTLGEWKTLRDSIRASEHSGADPMYSFQQAISDLIDQASVGFYKTMEF